MSNRRAVFAWAIVYAALLTLFYLVVAVAAADFAWGRKLWELPPPVGPGWRLIAMLVAAFVGVAAFVVTGLLGYVRRY